MLKKPGSAFILTFNGFHKGTKRVRPHFSHQFTFNKQNSNFKIPTLSAHDPVHQQEGHLWALHVQTGSLSAPQRRGYLRQIHQHVSIISSLGTFPQNNIQEVPGQVISQAQSGWLPEECLLKADEGAEWYHRLETYFLLKIVWQTYLMRFWKPMNVYNFQR